MHIRLSEACALRARRQMSTETDGREDTKALGTQGRWGKRQMGKKSRGMRWVCFAYLKNAQTIGSGEIVLVQMTQHQPQIRADLHRLFKVRPRTMRWVCSADIKNADP